MKNYNIYVVDDDENALFITKMLLDQLNSDDENLNVQTFEYPVELFDQLKSGELSQPELFIVDINMPRLTGFELIDRITELPSYSNDILIYIHSTSEREEDMERIKSSPFINGNYAKHMSRENLNSLVNEMKNNH